MPKKPLTQIENRRYSIIKSLDFESQAIKIPINLSARSRSGRMLGIQPSSDHRFQGIPNGGANIYYAPKKDKP
ncbi:hypothetical protein D3C87_1464250 [compost metagenome]